MDEHNEPHDLDCAHCGSGVPCLFWHDSEAGYPEGGYLAYQDDEHVCPECGALNQVEVDESADPPTASLRLIHCRHGRAEDEPCWVCDMKSKVSWWRCLLSRALRQIWCTSGGHEWTQYRWVPGKVHELCKCGVSREAPNA